MKTVKIGKPRPYWHVDAKWLTGILLLLLLNITFLLVLLVRITGPDQGITLLTTSMASAFSFEGGGMDSDKDMETVHQKIAESPNGAWQPISGLKIFVREQDIAGMTPREMRMWFFRQMAEPLYYDGPQGLANLATDPDIQKSFTGGVGPLGVISAANHSKLIMALIVSGMVSLLFLGLLIVFSYRYGRLGSPGCVIFLAALPGLLLMGGLRGWLEKASQNPPPVEQTTITRYTQLAVDVLPATLQSAMLTYGILVLSGFGLMLLAVLGAIFFRGRKAKKVSNDSGNSENKIP